MPKHDESAGETPSETSGLTAETDVSTVSPPPVDFVSDTGRLPSDAETSSSARYARARAEGSMPGSFRFEQRVIQYESGPFPSAETLRELAAIYPDSPRIVFEEVQLQSAHRRALETSMTAANNRRADNGQAIGGALGALALLCGSVVICMGHGGTGFAIIVTAIAGLAGVFAYGREGQKKERLEKAAIREKIGKGEPIEKLESEGLPSEKLNPKG